MSVKIQTSQNVEVEYELASIGDRILAQLIDYAVYVGWALLWALLLFKILNLGGGNAGIFYVILFIVVPMAVCPLVSEYFLDGQTLGKRALNIKVVRLDGGKPTLGSYVLRWVLIIIDGLVYWLVALITIAVNGKGQRLGDLAAGTTVIKMQKKVSLEDILYKKLPDNYQVTYPEVSYLNDTDIATIRQVLLKNNVELMHLAADKINHKLELAGYTDVEMFLKTIVNDYNYVVNKAAEND
jgi:uncharacterized RDD family membrane protein YckC